MPLMRRNLLDVSGIDREHIVFTLWILVTFVQFRGDELFLYPLAGYFAFAAVRDWRMIAPLLKASWPLILITTWSLMSVIWAVSRGGALKHGLMLLLTMIICYVVAARLDQRRVVTSVLGCACFIGLLSLGNLSSTGASSGVFSHKNALGMSMLLLWAAGLVVVLDRRRQGRIRVIGLVGVALGFFLILKSQSATALVMALGSGGIILGAAVFFREDSVMTAGRLGALALMGGLVTGVLGFVASTFREDPVRLFFDAVGKDTTLTGRTVLWQYAEGQIAAQPLLGVGNGGFWNYWASPFVQRIYAEFYKLPYHHFTFHNSFYELAVHLGLIGMTFGIIALVWAVLRIAVATLTLGGMGRVFFLVAVFVCTIRSFVESDLLRPFALLPMLVWIGALMTVKDSIAASRSVPWQR